MRANEVQGPHPLTTPRTAQSSHNALLWRRYSGETTPLAGNYKCFSGSAQKQRGHFMQCGTTYSVTPRSPGNSVQASNQREFLPCRAQFASDNECLRFGYLRFVSTERCCRRRYLVILLAIGLGRSRLHVQLQAHSRC